jgi:hypothetical protein
MTSTLDARNGGAPRHIAIFHLYKGAVYWTCSCGARSGPPFYATKEIAVEEWERHE